VSIDAFVKYRIVSIQAKEYEYTCTLKMTLTALLGTDMGLVEEKLRQQNIAWFVETAQMHYICTIVPMQKILHCSMRNMCFFLFMVTAYTYFIKTKLMA
jgi:hypothetical protein